MQVAEWESQGTLKGERSLGRAMAVVQSGPDSNPVGSPGLKLAAFYFVLDGFDQFELKVELFLNNSVRATIL